KIVLEYRPRRSPPAQTGDCRSNHPFRQLLTIINIRKATFGWPFSMTSRVNKPINLLSVCRILLVLACRATCADLHFDGTSGSQTSFSEESTFLIQIHGFSNNTPGLTSSTGGNSTTATTKARAPTGGTTSPGVPKYTLPRGKGEDAKAARQWLLVLADDATDGELANISREFADGQQTKPSSGQMPLVAGSLTEEALDAMLERYFGRVRFVEEDEYQLKVTDSLANTGTSSAGPARKAKTPTYPWGIQYVEADACRGKGAGVHVYVLDTGIRITHNEFGGRAFAGVDVAASGTYPGTLTVCSPLSTTCAADFHGHGSHCAGTAGASTYGVADGATLWAMKVLDNSGSGWTSWSILAEQWILSSGNRPAVVSISIQANYNSYAEETSIDNLVADGVTVVVAAGNYNQDACLWNPAWISSAITVAAFGGTSGNSWDRSGYSNWGSCIDAYAPGTNILSTGPWSDTHTYSSTGTSMACPHISGLAARMYEAYPTAGSMTAAARWTLLTATSCTGCVTNDATPSPTVNLVIKALSCSTSNITASPTASPTGSPTALPTASPTATPTLLPTVSPTPSPTVSPTASPSATPTASPTASPTVSPTGSPTAPPTSPTPAPSWSQVVNNCTVCPDIQIFSDCPGHSPDSCASAGTTSPGCEWCPLVNECRVKCTCHDDAPPAYSLFDSCAYSGGVPTQQVLFWPIFLSPSYTSYAPECECPSWRTPAPTVDTTDPTPSPTQEGDPSPAPTKQGQDPTPAPTRRPTPSPTEQTNEPTPSPTPEGQDPTPAPTKQGQDPTPAPTRRPTPSPTHTARTLAAWASIPPTPSAATSGTLACCPPPQTARRTTAEISASGPAPPSIRRLLQRITALIRRRPRQKQTKEPTPSPTPEGQDPTPAPTKQGQDPTPAPTRWPTPSPTEQTKEPTPSPTPEGQDPTPAPTRRPTPSPTEQTKEPTPSPTPEGQDPTPAPTKQGQDPTPAPTRWPTPSPTPSCEDACCVGVDPTDPKCCHLWNAGAVSSPADCEAYNGGDFCVWTCPTEHPTPAPTHHGFDPTPSPTEQTKAPTRAPTRFPTPYPTPSPTIGLAPTPKLPWEPVATPNPTPIPTPSPTIGLAPTPKLPWEPVATPTPTPIPTPSPTFGSVPAPKGRQAKVEGSFQVKVPSADVEAFVSDSSVKAAFQRSVAEKAGVAEAEVVVTLSVVTGAGSAGRGRKVRLAPIMLGSADQAEIQVDYSISVEEGAEGNSVQGALATVTAEQFTSPVAGASSFAVQAVPASATAPTVSFQVSATGDPHLVNVYGQRFDLMQPGNHTMLLIPRGAPPSATLLGVVARAEHIGKACSEMYIVALTVTGQWVAGVPGAQRLGEAWNMQYFANKPAQRGSSGAGWNTYGNIRMKVNWGHTVGGVKYINLLVRNLAHSGYTVGGLLGEGDHTFASTPMAHCRRFSSL
ncbi:unnamed protein product, partial [Prorocentrum cordatum]